MDKVAGTATRAATRSTGDRDAAVRHRVHRTAGRDSGSAEVPRRPAGGTGAAAGGVRSRTRPSPDDGLDDDQRLNPERILTLIGLVGLAVGAFAFDLDVGFTALGVAVGLTLIFPRRPRARSTRSAGAPCC